VIALSAGAGATSAVVDPHAGGRIERLVVENLDLLVPPEVNDHDYGCFPMAPWAGRVRRGMFTFDGDEHQLPLNKPPHAIHGTVRNEAWTVEEQSHSTVVLATKLHEPWPFRGEVRQRMSLLPDALALEMEVHAVDEPMPATCGWHPWWSREVARGEPVEVELHASRMYERDDEGIPTGELVPIHPPPWDDCFTDLHQPAVILRWPGAAVVTIESDCPCVVVFTEPEHAVCVEPQSGPPDALNLDPHVVEPGRPLVVRSTWSWTLHG
jgi:galactose mutarotase-like enzyme